MSGRRFPISRDEKLVKVFHFRLSDEDREFVCEAAREDRCGYSTFLRKLMEREREHRGVEVEVNGERRLVLR